MMGNPLMNDASLSQTAGRAKTRQSGLLVKPRQIVLSSFDEWELHFKKASPVRNMSAGPLPASRKGAVRAGILCPFSTGSGRRRKHRQGQRWEYGGM